MKFREGEYYMCIMHRRGPDLTHCQALDWSKPRVQTQKNLKGPVHRIGERLTRGLGSWGCRFY